MDAEEIFLAATEILDEAHRRQFLANAFSEHPHLEQEVLSLLRSHALAGDFLQSPAAHGTPASEFKFAWNMPQPGTRIGPYLLEQVIGRGGMGVVFSASQDQPFRRRVALKIIQPGISSRKVLARFEAERQALAIMDHPNIARVIDAGVLPNEKGEATGADGIEQPYFVMELIDGIPITTYCDQARMTPRQRLELMIPICEAIQHAHQKGVIHRDIKPSNVLITEYDSRPVPKIIDFGVAKAIGTQLSDLSLQTDFGQVVGTLEYMSPEQAGLNQQDVDSRSDIYSLGVLLYELLTGTTPLNKKQLSEAAMMEVFRIIQQVEPQRPSTRISTTDEAPSVAANRNTEPARLSGLVRGDLDWIAMKALEKDRSRRYQTANALAVDLRHFLQDEPVTASPPSAGYRLRKFIRRNRIMATASAGIALAIVIGAAVSTLGWMEAHRQFKIASEAESKQREARELAETRLKQVESGITVLSNVFRDLTPGTADDVDDNTDQRDLRIALANRLEGAARQIQTENMGDPLGIARLQYQLGISLLELKQAARAREVFTQSLAVLQRELGAEHLETLNCLDRLALCLQQEGKRNEALELFQKVLESKRRTIGESHLDSLATGNNIASLLTLLGRFDEAIAQHESSIIAMTENFGIEAPVSMSAINNLGVALVKAGRASSAVKSLEENLERRQRVLGKEHPDTSRSIESLAMCYRSLGQREKVAPLLEESLRVTQSLYGPDNPKTLRCVSNLAIILQDLGDNKRSIPLLEQVLRQRRILLGSEHPDALASASNLGIAYRRDKRYGEAIALLQESLDGRRRTLGADHPDTLSSLNNLATCWKAQGEAAKALPLLEEAVASRRRVLGNEHPDVFESLNNLAGAVKELNQYERAESIYREVIAGREKLLGLDHPSTFLAIYNFASMYRDWNRTADAIPLLEAVVARGATREGGLPLTFQRVPEVLAEFYRDADRLDDSLRQIRKVLDEYRETRGHRSPEALRMMAALGRTLMETQQHEEAEQVIRSCLDLRKEVETESWTTFYTQSLLGAVLLKKASYPESEQLLLAGLAGMESRRSEIPITQRDRRISENREWLAELYTALNRPDDAVQFKSSQDVK